MSATSRDRPQDPATDPDGTSRRSFLRASGGVAAIVAVPTAAVAASTASAATASAAPRTVPNPTSPAPSQPLMAYVHDAARGTVVIMHGATERTVHDPELVRRLTITPATAKHRHRRPAKAKRTARS